VRSIRRSLTAVLVSSLILVIFSAAIHGYRNSADVSGTFMDQELQSVMYTVAVGQGLPVNNMQQSALVYQVWQDNQLIARSQSAPESPIARVDDGYSDRNFNARRWRVLSKTLDEGLVVMVAQPLQNRVTLLESLTVSVITPFIFAVPILAAIIFISVSRGLRPLKLLSEKLSNRKGKDLSTVSLPKVPQEMQPVMATLNSMFSRLQDAFDREQQFASNAAHELRTPLSVMKINLHNVAKELPDAGLRLATIQKDTDRMIHVVNQILLLSRTSPELFHLQLGRVDVFEVAQKVITDLYSKIESRQQEISLEGDSVVLQSTEFTLYTLLQNLIGNAIAYSPDQAVIQVAVQRKGTRVELIVEDSGPGVPEEERANVLKRFHRNKTQEQHRSTGSGLGLAIVGQIVMLHHGQIALGKATLGGLKVVVTLPVDEENA